MMKLKKFIRKMFSTDYRMAVEAKGKIINIYGFNTKQMKGIANRTPNLSRWALYKTGPLFLPEREIDSYVKEGKQ